MSFLTDKEKSALWAGIYGGKYSPSNIPLNVYFKTAEKLMKSIFEGYGKSFISDDLTTGDLDALNKMHKNVYLFSGAKTADQARILQVAMFTPDGYLRPFKEFLKASEKIDALYNKHWLKAEQQLALQNAQSARQWKEIWKVKETFPLLMYQTQEDGHVRISHQLLNGITKPVDHPFWKTYFPPNDWGCRCDHVSLSVYDHEDETKDGKMPDPDDLKKSVNPLFAFNAGRKKEPFSKAHPYFERNLKKYPYLKDIIPNPPKPLNKVVKG